MTLGAFLKSMRGKCVTQEETAEAAGMSRVWYAMLESDAATQTSTRALGRLADVLMLSAAERVRLFQLAIREVPALPQRTALPEDMLDAFAWLRTAAKRLWSASTEVEALTIAAEAAADRFRDAPLTQNLVRTCDGSWPTLLTLGDSHLVPRATECIERLSELLGPAGMDELRCYPQLSQPGDVYTEEEWMSKSIRDQLLPVLAEYGFDVWSFLCGRVRTRTGWIAGVHVRRRMRRFSDTEKAELSSLTALTSLALA